MVCQKCGTEFNSEFCPKCGAKANNNAANAPTFVQSSDATIIFKPTKIAFLIPGLKRALIKVGGMEKVCKFREQESFYVRAGNTNIFACVYKYRLFPFVKVNCFKIDQNIKLEGGKIYEVIYKTPLWGIIFISKGKLEIHEVE